MKFKIVRSKFLEGLKKVQNVSAAKGSLLILQNVLLEAKEKQLFLTVTDLDITIRSVVECDIEMEGSTTLPVKLLFNAIAKSPEGMIEVDVDPEDHAQISAGSVVFKLSGLSVVDFPTLPADQNSFEYVLSQLTLREMLRKTSYAASQDDTRRTLKGVLMSFRDAKVTMVATDGRRLALVEHEIDLPAEAQKDIILPTKVVAELQRSLGTDGDARITIENSQVSFKLGDTRLYSKLIDDVYPNYHQVIPAGLSESITIDRQLLLAALDRVRVMMKDDSNSTKLIFDANELIVRSNGNETDSARDSVPIKYAGPHIEISFNPDFVMDPLKAIDEDEVIIELNDGSKPAILKCSVPFLYVMMPLRIN